MNNTTHAGLSVKGYHAIVNGKWAHSTPTGHALSSLLTDMIERGFTHLWIQDTIDIGAFEAWLEEAQPAFKLLINYKIAMKQKVGVKSLTAYRAGGGQAKLMVIFPSHSQWKFERGLAIQDVLIAVRYLETALAVPITSSPAGGGMALLKQINSGHDAWLEKPLTNLQELHFDSKEVAADVNWSRPVTVSETGRKYLHKLDKNAAYLRACVEQMFGAGEPMHITSDGYQIYKNLPSVWKCSLGQLPYAPMLPPRWEGGNWIAAPIVKMLLVSGVQLEIEEGYAFKEAHGTLKNWAVKLWDVRKAFRDTSLFPNTKCAEIARDMSKSIATKTVGLSAYGHFEEDDNYKERPDFKVGAVAGNYATMFYNMDKIAKLYNLYPVIAYTDALYYLTDHEDITLDMPDMPFNKTSLGGYKHEWTLPVDAQVLDCLNSGKAPAVQLAYLNNLVKLQSQKAA